MTNQRSGLRFDIYERVHLSEGVLGIKELEEVELVPHIQVLSQGEQALLRGNLLLTGTYVDEQDRTGQTLEHLIPVEITLPLNRVHRVEDIAVEIDNFDIDLLSGRSLNITGVLSLGGLEVVSSPEEDTWRSDREEEEVLFVHEARAERTEEPAFYGDVSPGAVPPAVESESAVPDNTKPDLEANEEAAPESAPVSWMEPQEQEAEEAEPFFLLERTVPEEPPEEAAREPKVSFGRAAAEPAEPEAPPAAEVPAPPRSFGVASLIDRSSARRETRSQPEPPPLPAVSPSEKVEWKNLLLNSRDEQQEFRKVRLCIVQKNETLESIAERYNLSTRELALHNRLGDVGVSEGQIVYIPKV
ncbi:MULTISPECIES: LysM peptidoglycan-binding domain-containing protein [Paenibacillus]|uniref:LysM peptidoglycan-binding domain-containing protein n=1 Tax=Paenibacillus TaxID=44249 RepID=UPI0022B88C53|nr:LysM peptidoglycan-binding domain-containing protein [Paenibacillus caseinilyticus]MCZ8519099.1 LysM peptidoglycan-binding domain-containing protein [Paenibacillus caseinilyticus]